MNLTLRIICIAGALVTLGIVINKVRRRKVQMEDSLFWIMLCALLLLIALVPGIPAFFSNALGFMSPSNFVFVSVIAVLLVKLFSLSGEVSALKHRLNELAQEFALREEDNRHGDGPAQE